MKISSLGKRNRALSKVARLGTAPRAESQEYLELVTIGNDAGFRGVDVTIDTDPYGGNPTVHHYGDGLAGIVVVRETLVTRQIGLH